MRFYNQLTALSIVLFAAEAVRAAEFDTKYIPKEAFLLFVAHPRATLAKAGAAATKLESLLSEFNSDEGIDLHELEEFVAVQGMTAEQGSLSVVVFRFHKPVEKEPMLKMLLGNGKHPSSEVKGKEVYSAQWRGAICFADPQTVVFVQAVGAGQQNSDEALLSVLETEGADNAALKRLKELDASLPAFGAYDMALVRQFLKQNLGRAPGLPLPGLADLPDLLAGGVGTFAVDAKLTLKIILEATSADNGAALKALINAGVELGKQAMAAKDAIKQAAPASERELAGSMLDLAEKALKEIEVVHDATKVTAALVEFLSVEDAATLFAKLIAARAGGAGVGDSNNMRQIGLALHNYHSVNSKFPNTAIAGAGGKRLLSWRVAMLPYLDENDLYKEFKQDEPWDSDHNRKLIERMPKAFSHSKSKSLNKDGKTRYLLPVGPGTIFADNVGKTMQQITDGTSNTVMVVEADETHAVEWTKPDDLEYNPEKPLEGLADRDGTFTALFADGSVDVLKRSTDAALAAVFTAAGGEVVDRAKLSARQDLQSGVGIQPRTP